MTGIACYNFDVGIGNVRELEHITPTNEFLLDLAVIIFYRKRGGCGRCARFCASLAIAVFITVFLSAGGNGKADTDNLRSGQAHHVVDSVAVPAPPVENNYGSEWDTTSSIMVDEEVLQEAIDEASGDIKQVEQEELEKEDAVLVKEASGLGNKLRVRMGGIFSKTLTYDEMNAVATEVEEKLTQEAESKLHDQADQMAEKDVENMLDMVDGEEANGMETDEIEKDVRTVGAAYTEGLRVGIDEAADDVKLSMKKRAAEIEKEILEERLSIKMGKKVKLVIVDDEVQGVDELLSGLDNLAPHAAQLQAHGYYGAPPPQQPATPSYGTTSNSYGAPPAQTTYGATATQPDSSTFGAAAPVQPAFGSNLDFEDPEDKEERAEEDSDGDEESEEDNKSGEENGSGDADQEEEEGREKTTKKKGGWW